MPKITQDQRDAGILSRVKEDFTSCAVPVRDDLANAHAMVLSRLARPGTWWTGAERIAIAAEARAANTCAFCVERKQALSPYTIEGTHTTDPLSEGVLFEPMIGMIHMMVTDVTRITKQAIDDLSTSGFTHGHYVEALGIVVAVRSMDQTNKGLGVPVHGLPSPVAGEPSQAKPGPLVEGEAFVPMLARQEPDAPDQDLWGGDFAKSIPNVARALSLVPDAVRDWFELSDAQYIPAGKFGAVTEGRNLSRAQIELLAARVSALNDCFY